MNQKTRVSAYLPKPLSDRLDEVYNQRKKIDRSISYSDLICEALWIYTSQEVSVVFENGEVTKEKLEQLYYGSQFDDFE